MTENLIMMSDVVVPYAKTVTEKAEDYICKYNSDNSVYRTLRVMLSVLKYEYTCACDEEEYESFICDLLGTMSSNADKNNFNTEINVIDIMKQLPYMSIGGLQITIMEAANNIALFELVIDEYINYNYQTKLDKTGLKFVDDNKKEEDDEFLLKKIDAE